MANNTAANVLVGATGHVYGAPAATALPTTEIAALNGAFVNLGYISDAGVVQHIGGNTTPIKAWGGDIIRKIRTEHDLTYAFTMIETNPTSLAAYYGAQSDPAVAIQIKANNNVRQEWVIDVVDGTNGYIRIVIPDGEVLDTGDVTYSTNGVVEYPIVISAYADSSGVKAYKYVHDTSAS